MKRVSTFIIILIFIATATHPFLAFGEAAGPSPSVPSALLMDQATGTVLYEKNPDEKRAPASVTKVMTMLLIAEALEKKQITLETTIDVSAEAAAMGGSQVYLKEGEQMSVHDMLKCIAVVSANDCCVAMAEALAGSTEAFIEQMNKRAAALGMKNTHFNSCTGLDTEDHYTTARDIAIMSRALMQHKLITDYTTIWMDTVRDGAFALSNTNKLIRYYNGATGLKTGYTEAAGYCLSAAATRDSLSLIAVVLGGETSDQRFEDAKALLNYGFNQYELYTASPAEPEPVNVIKGMEDQISPKLAEIPSFLVKKGEAQKIQYTVSLPESVLAPVEAGQKLGTIDFTLGEKALGSVMLIAEKKIHRVTFSHLFFHLIQYFFKV